MIKLCCLSLNFRGFVLFSSIASSLVWHVQGSEHMANATCAANDLCSNLAGDCCPTSPESGIGVDLFCCDTTEGSCGINPRCVDANVTGECCPTIDNVFLDCCERPFAQCAAHPDCAHLAGDCCPTPSGVFLDCCLEDQALQNITFPINDTAALCSSNPGCYGLADACCPTADGVYLYCCGQEPRDSGYQVIQTLVSPSVPEPQQLAYLVSSSPYRIASSASVTGTPPSPQSVVYERNSSEIFDLIYYRTGASAVITDAMEFVSGKKKFYLNVWTDAPACTQVLLQLDNLPLATPENFPTGRHSRYISFTTKEQEWERMEFDYLDSLDDTLPADQINAVVLFFDPGHTDTYTYYFDFLDIAEEGCTANCEAPSVKDCPAYFSGEDQAGLPDGTSPPTEAPTRSPTEAPTNLPTSAPTSSPTVSPTMAPTSQPTRLPTANPTSAPTLNPTSSPTLSPTSSPTNVPTTSPVVETANPTAVPLTSPPTSSPTSLPTVSPTAEPTGTPTGLPTSMPTNNPTGTPTVSPTFSPTDSPTEAPISPPTDTPTDTPTMSPSTRPPVPTRTIFLWDAPSCADGIDNDGDGYEDCTDPDCCLTIQCYPWYRRSYSRATYQLSAESVPEDEDDVTRDTPPSTSANHKQYVFLSSVLMSCLALCCLTF